MDKKSLKIRGLIKLLIGQIIFVGMFYVPIGQVLIPVSLFFIVFGFIQFLRKSDKILTRNETYIKKFLVVVNIIFLIVTIYAISRITG